MLKTILFEVRQAADYLLGSVPRLTYKVKNVYLTKYCCQSNLVHTWIVGNVRKRKGHMLENDIRSTFEGKNLKHGDNVGMSYLSKHMKFLLNISARKFPNRDELRKRVFLLMFACISIDQGTSPLSHSDSKSLS
jgi:hypothetical protein